jgi:hypothetical protein
LTPVTRFDGSADPFGELQGLPKDFKPVTLWPERDSAWRDVSQGIERAIQSIREKR